MNKLPPLPNVNSDPTTVYVCWSCLQEDKLTEFDFELAKVRKLSADDPCACMWCYSSIHRVKIRNIEVWDRV